MRYPNARRLTIPADPESMVLWQDPMQTLIPWQKEKLIHESSPNSD